MPRETLDYKDGDTVLEAYISYEDSPDWSGRWQFVTEAADTIAELGHVGFAVDMYGKGVFGEDGNVDLNSSLMNPLANDRAALRRRMLVALKVGLDLPKVDSS